MATVDRFGASEHRSEARARSLDKGLLLSATTWFAVGAVGMVVLFIGLGVDAYKHNQGIGEESILTLSNPGHLISAIGIALATLAVVAGFTVSALQHVEEKEQLLRRFAAVGGVWVLVVAAAVGTITYVAATDATIGHSHGDGTLVAADHDHIDGGDANIGARLQEEGVIDSDGNPVDPELALARDRLMAGGSGHDHGMHDYGPHPTFTQFISLSDEELLPMFPEGTMTAEDLPLLREQIEQVRAFADGIKTVEDAEAAGYRNTTSDVPFMGMHYLNTQYVTNGEFDPSRPEGLLFSNIDDGPPKLVGVWFLQIPGIGGVTRDQDPEGFAGNLDLWHAHIGLCLVGTSGASEGETEESCREKGGRFTADLRWMMHVWVTPETTENADGFFAYLNEDLYQKQVAAQRSDDAQSGVTNN
jgi:hypothetical protein